MNFLFFTGVVLFVIYNYGEVRADDASGYEGSYLYEGSTKSYGFEDSSPGSASREHGGWKKIRTERSRHDQRSYDDTATSANDVSKEENNRISLKDFLEKYAQNLNKRKAGKPVEVVDDKTYLSLDKLIEKDHEKNKEKEPVESGGLSDKKDKSKSWALLNVERHKHPYDDRKGWVSMEPIPWSISKVSKWHSKYKPTPTPHDHEIAYHSGYSSTERPWENDFDYRRPTVSITPPSPYLYNHHQNSDTDRYDLYGSDFQKPRPSSIYPRPSATFGHRVHLQTSYGGESRPHYQNTKNCNHPEHHGVYPSEDIITDGSPSNFPTASPYDNIRRRGTEVDMHPDNHPFTGSGEWVLLSTTKGYKPQKSRQRSLDLGITQQPMTNSVRAHKSIKLTVLPPLKNSKVNMTTSHGGLIQVDSVPESVEEAKEKNDIKKHLIKIKNLKKKKKGQKHKNNHEFDDYDDKSGSTQALATSVPKGVSPTDPAAVMAAIGAGLIPATMAMMVPFAMNGRRKRSIHSRELNSQIPLSRYYY